jgi:hypothetical protein
MMVMSRPIVVRFIVYLDSRREILEIRIFVRKYE